MRDLDSLDNNILKTIRPKDMRIGGDRFEDGRYRGTGNDNGC